jgi:hypothetical protein
VGGVNRPPLRSSNVRETFCQRGNTHVYRRVVSEKCGPRQYHGCIPAAFRAWVFSFGERVQSTSGSNVRFSRLWSLALRVDRNGSTYVEDGVWMKGQGLGYHGCTPSSIPTSRLKSPSSTCEQTLGQDVGQNCRVASFWTTFMAGDCGNGHGYMNHKRSRMKSYLEVYPEERGDAVRHLVSFFAEKLSPG